jgi:hypothetical protein
MTDRTDRRTDHARRRRVDLLLARVRSARDEIIGRGLEAVHPSPPREQAVPEASGDEADAKPPAPRADGSAPKGSDPSTA